MNNELYKVEQKQSSYKDSIIAVQSTRIINRDSVINYKDTIITINNLKLKDLDKKFQAEEKLRIKYQKRASKIPVWFGSGTVVGMILCLLLAR